MAEGTSSQAPVPGLARRFPVRMIAQFVVVMVFLPAVIFIAAGTLKWWNAWAYYAAVVAGALGSRLDNRA